MVWKQKLEENDIKILCRLRKNSRENLTRMSRLTNIPISTLYDKIKKFEGNIINKHTIILNFKNIGYDLRVTILLKAPREAREAFEKFLKSNENVNSLFRINNGYDFMAEIIFKDMKDFKDFTDKIAEFGVNTMQEFFVLEDIKREGFLTEEIFLQAS